MPLSADTGLAAPSMTRRFAALRHHRDFRLLAHVAAAKI